MPWVRQMGAFMEFSNPRNAKESLLEPFQILGIRPSKISQNQRFYIRKPDIYLFFWQTICLANIYRARGVQEYLRVIKRWLSRDIRSLYIYYVLGCVLDFTSLQYLKPLGPSLALESSALQHFHILRYQLKAIHNRRLDDFRKVLFPCSTQVQIFVFISLLFQSKNPILWRQKPVTSKIIDGGTLKTLNGISPTFPTFTRFFINL